MPILDDPRREAFAQARATGATATAAAKLAGFSERSARFQGSRLLADRNIAQRVEELQNRIVDGAVLATTVNRAYVIEKLRLILERCSEQGEDGKMLSPSAACRAAELLGKELGMFVEKRDVNVNFHVDIAERLRRGRLRAAERAREAEASRRVIDVVAEEKSP